MKLSIGQNEIAISMETSVRSFGSNKVYSSKDSTNTQSNHTLEFSFLLRNNECELTLPASDLRRDSLLIEMSKNVYN